MERIDINELKPGMFVAGVIDKNHEMSIKQCGVVKSEGIISALKKNGVRQVMVDFNIGDGKPIKSKIIKPIIKESKEKKRPSLFKNLHYVKKLFDEASIVQKNIALKIHDKKSLDIKSIEEVTAKLVGAVIDNDEALWFMTRIRKQDAYLMEHSLNVGIMLGLFSKYLGFEESLIHELVLAGFLHDIGKLMIPEKIINKKGKLTEDEYRIMKGHVILSREIIENQFHNISAISLTTLATHHEKMDGSGYPDGLKGDDIPFYGKMISIVDVFDAITAKRCYKGEVTNISALRILMSESGKAFDPYLVTQFIKFIGTYPAGTLVELSNAGAERLAIIESVNKEDPLKPKVKVFFNTKSKNYIEIESIDLISSSCAYELKKAVTPQEYNIDMSDLVERCF